MNHKAMALVEIIVSMLVLAVAALAVTSTVSLVSSNQARSAGGSSLDLQAESYARQTLETLKNAVSTNATTSAPLLDTSYTAPCATAAGIACGAGISYTQTLPSSDILTHSGTRTYKVWDISGGNNTVAYKKVTVTVQWTD